MTGVASVQMVISILLIWGGLVGSVVALKVLTPPYVKGENYEDIEVAALRPGLSEDDFIVKEIPGEA